MKERLAQEFNAGGAAEGGGGRVARGRVWAVSVCVHVHVGMWRHGRWPGVLHHGVPEPRCWDIVLS